jgi:hypothetical protein
MTRTWTLLMTLTLAACATDDPATGDDTGATVEDPCQASVLEDDFALDAGEGSPADPATWGALPPTAIVAGTYLRLDPEGLQVFGEVAQPVIGELMAMPEGLIAWSTGASDAAAFADHDGPLY